MKNVSVTEAATEYIRDHIRSGEWPVGTKIPSENELCSRVGASRTSIRSALQRFIMVGVLESYHGKGTFVVSDGAGILGSSGNGEVTKHEDRITLKEWHQARNLIEPNIVYRVAETATDDFVRSLRENCEKQRQLIGFQEEFIKTDIAFHMMLADYLNNRLISEMLWNLLNNPDIHRKNNDEFGYYGGIHFHMLITDAIHQRNPERASNLMSEHGREADIRFGSIVNNMNTKVEL